jgi:tetratricopeptide (TPR) repeat protein
MKKSIAAVGAMILLVFAFSLFNTPAAEEKKPSKKVVKLMNQAQKAIQDKQPDKAIDLLQQVIALDPGNAMVQHNLGVLFHDKGRTAEAIACFEEALRLQPGYQNALLALRQALFEAGKSESGKKEYAKANAYLLKLEGLPRPAAENIGLLASAQYLHGFNLFNLKQYTEAIGYFEKCQASENLEKESPELYANATYFLGMMAYIQGHYADSNEYFYKFLALFPEGSEKPEFFIHANYFVGANLFRILEAKLAKGDVSTLNESAQEILPYLKMAVENKLPSEDAYVMLGNCYVYLKEYDQALQTYRQLIELFPQSQQLKNYQAFLPELEKMQQQDQKAKKKR